MLWPQYRRSIVASMPPTTPGERRPNVLLILVDQMRLPRWFPAALALPAYDRLRREGRVFSNAFVSANPCSPSRAGIVTGLHYTQHGVHSNVVGPRSSGMPSLDPRWPTFAHAFRRAGYRTPYFGKWHLTAPDDYAAAGLSAYGFEAWQGPDCEGLPLQGLREDGGFAGQAAAWLAEQATRGPWLLTCSFINPHDIMFFCRTMPPDDCAERCALPANHADDLIDKPRIQAQYQRFWGGVMGMTPDQPEELWRRYGDFYLYLTEKVDAEVAHVLAALDASGVANDTLTIFLSDHGDMAGAHKLQGKGPFVYHENVQVPLIFRWPGRIAPATSTDTLAQSIDLFPTLLDLAGIGTRPPHLPGRSLAPLVLGEHTAVVNDHIILSWGMTMQRARPTRASASTIPDEVHGLFDGRYKLGRYFADGVDDELELYDLRDDPLELRNLARDAAYARLTRSMADRLRDAEASEMRPMDPRDVPAMAGFVSS
jgi:arylsulfatase A-like enzyme